MFSVVNLLYAVTSRHGRIRSGFQLRGRETSGRRPRGARHEWPRAWIGFLGGGIQPPPHQLGGLGERCKLPQRGSGRSPGRQAVLPRLKYILRNASPDTSVLLLLLKIRSRVNALVCCQKLLTLDPSHYLIQFGIVQASAPFPVDFARVTCVRFVTHNLI